MHPAMSVLALRRRAELTGAFGGGPDRVLDDRPEASLLQHMDGGGGGPTRRCDLGPQLEGAEVGLDEQGTGTLDGLVDQAFGEIAG